MNLYYSLTSPYVRKVNVCAIELGLDDKLERIVTNPWETDESLLEDNPLSKVPTLITDDGIVLYDSPVICEYLDTVYGDQALIPAGGAERWSALRLQALGDGMMDAAVLRFLERKRPAPQQSREWDKMQRITIQRALNYLEDKVSDWKTDVTIGQITVACALGYLDFRFAEDNWRQGQPGLVSWFADFSERTSMQATLAKTGE
jgi:glutathione S-transferase